MSNADNSDRELDAKTAGQIDPIEEEFSEHGIDIGHTTVNGGLGFMYQKGVILVRDEYLGRVLEFVRRDASTGPGRHDRDQGGESQDGKGPGDGNGNGQGDGSGQGDGDGRPVRPVIRGVTLVALGDTRFAEGGTLVALDEIDREMGSGAATPNHVLTVSVKHIPHPVHTCPATEPEEVVDGIEPSPGVCPGDGGSGVRIFIADTGLLEGAAQQHSWLNDVAGDVDPWLAPGRPSPPPDLIRPYTGHGTFVAGVTRCMAPAADIYVANVFRIAGSALESYAVRKLSRALEDGYDIIHMTIATATRQSLPLLSFEAWRRQVRDYQGVVSVVAAGNSSSWKPFWPAAFPEMVSVGALAADWRSRASFSNYGGWVDVYAPGRDLVNAYASGTYRCTEKPYQGDVREFYGMARWSGTSFSTPIVTGLIAARMSATGENAAQAADAMLAIARAQAIPGTGPVLLPCLDNHGQRCCPCGPGGTGGHAARAGCGCACR